MILLSLLFTIAQAETLKEVYSGKIPVSNYNIKLELPEGWNDPGEFTTLTITEGNKVMYTIKDLQASKFTDVREFPKTAQTLGDYLKIFPVSATSKDRFLAFTDWAGGSNWDRLVLLYIPAKGKITRVFEKSMIVAAIKDYDGDGLYDILKEGGKGEPTSDNNFSYDPYLVYLQIKKGKNVDFKINGKLSRKWSEENKFYWHGTKYDAKLRVDKSGELVR